jgi:hypothetical protein
MPTQNRIRREQRTKLLQQLVNQNLTFHPKSSSLVVVQSESFLSKLLLKHLVLGQEILAHLLLLMIYPASGNKEYQVPRLQDETLERSHWESKWSESSRCHLPITSAMNAIQILHRRRPGQAVVCNSYAGFASRIRGRPAC